jgi:hypothetical protein
MPYFQKPQTIALARICHSLVFRVPSPLFKHLLNFLVHG